uniref:Ras-related protein Rab-44 n=1 Tax=Panagrellus redivivus TaxID=6233 RepID=A0A7E4W025_PANRE
MHKKGFVQKEDLRQLHSLVPNLLPSDLDALYNNARSIKTHKVDREGFVHAIKPYLVRGKSNCVIISKNKHIRDVSQNMFKTISLDNDDSKVPATNPSDGSVVRVPKLSISLDEKLGSIHFLPPRRLTDSDMMAETLRLPSGAEDYSGQNSPAMDRTFSLPEKMDLKNDTSPIVSLKKQAQFETEQIEQRNHSVMQEVIRRSSVYSDASPVKPPARPMDLGPLISNEQIAEDGKTPERIFKVLFVGDSAVGKTCFLHRFCHSRFKPLFNATIGVDFTVKTIKLHDRVVAVQLWDTAGQERFRSITKQYFRKADSVVLMYDVTSEQSFLNIRDWIESVRVGVDDGCVLCLVGNKVDLASNEKARKVRYEDGMEIAQEFDMLFFETSAYTGLGINDCMRALAIQLQQREDDQLEEALRLEMTIQGSKHSWCCV